MLRVNPHVIAARTGGWRKSNSNSALNEWHYVRLGVFIELNGLSVIMDDQKRTILVIDDEEAIRKILNIHLSKEGYDVIQSPGDKWPNREHINIVDLPMEDATRIFFSRKVLERNPEDVMMEWASKRITNTANNPPMIIKSPVLVQSWVATQKWAIGYIPANLVDPTKVKVALTIH